MLFCCVVRVRRAKSHFERAQLLTLHAIYNTLSGLNVLLCFLSALPVRELPEDIIGETGAQKDFFMTATAIDTSASLKAVCPRKDLYEAVQTVGHAVSGRNALPILSHIMVQA